MSDSQLSTLQPQQRKLWVKESIRAFRENSFFMKFMGSDANNIVQLVTELKKTEKGDRAGISLVAELSGSGVVGDNTLEGNEEALDASWQEIKIDQMRNGVISKGKMEDQKSVLDFRMESKDKLAFWRAKVFDELCILTASGISYGLNTDGSTRTVTPGQQNPTALSFASDVSAPSAKRHYAFNGTNLVAGDTSTITSSYVPKLNMLFDLTAQAKTDGIKPIMVKGKEHYVFLCHPMIVAALKKDSDFRNVVVNANARSSDHPIFTGADIILDGIVIQSSNRVFNTKGAANGDKWGAAGAVNGTRSLLMGAQALAAADLYGAADWNENSLTDYGNKHGISIGMMFGLLKPKFKSAFNGNSVEDFGVVAVDTYIA